MAIINSQFSGIGTVLQSSFSVPEYQRGYSWEKDQVDDFWSDFIQLYEDDDLNEHFLGQVVIHKEGNKTRNIIDGQQRITTSLIFLDAFRTKALEFLNSTKNVKAVEYAREIVQEVNVNHLKNSTFKKEVKLRLGEADDDFFQKYIVPEMGYKKEIVIKDLSSSEKLIYNSSSYLNKQLEEYLNQFNDDAEKANHLYDMFDEFLKNMIVMYVETNSLNEAFIIFESLNARGKDLETSDLLKNHLFRVGQNRIEEVKSNWSKMALDLDGVDLTAYIRYLWNAENHFVTRNKLYMNIRSKVNTVEDSVNLSEKLLELSRLYRALVLPEEENYFNKLITKTLIKLHELNAKTYYPIIIAMKLKKYEDDDIGKVLKAIEVLLVRNVVVGGMTANTLEKEFAKIALKTSKYELKNVEDIVAELKKLTLSDNEFKANFATFTVRRPQTIRYLLRELENFEEREIKVNEDNMKVHIEHIMPKSPKKNDWGIIKEDHEQYLQRLGNLTLLGDEKNQSASNAKFDRKKEIYSESKISMTQELTKNKTWTIKDIEKRQKDLADKAIKVWSKNS